MIKVETHPRRGRVPNYARRRSLLVLSGGVLRAFRSGSRRAVTGSGPAPAATRRLARARSLGFGPLLRGEVDHPRRQLGPAGRSRSGSVSGSVVRSIVAGTGGGHLLGIAATGTASIGSDSTSGGSTSDVSTSGVSTSWGGAGRDSMTGVSMVGGGSISGDSIRATPDRWGHRVRCPGSIRVRHGAGRRELEQRFDGLGLGRIGRHVRLVARLGARAELDVDGQGTAAQPVALAEHDGSPPSFAKLRVTSGATTGLGIRKQGHAGRAAQRLHADHFPSLGHAEAGAPP